MNKTAIVERAGEMTKAPDYPALHGLRGIAAMTVVLQHFTTDARWHAKLFLHAGAIGVALFFVLSGFLMGRLYAPSACTVPAVLTFWRRRVARVMPLYLACVFAAYAFLHITGHNRPLFTVRWEDLWEHLMLWRASSVMWTIPIEMQFYALFPLIWLGRSRWRDATIVGLLLIVALLAALHPTRVPPLVPFAQFFILGVLAAQLNLRSIGPLIWFSPWRCACSCSAGQAFAAWSASAVP
jgi:peptidoglycan/LPS O-acetylase OafA/YrhL